MFEVEVWGGSWNAQLQLSPLKIVGWKGLLAMLLTVRVAGSKPRFNMQVVGCVQALGTVLAL
jgi:hypothetical protein